VEKARAGWIHTKNKTWEEREKKIPRQGKHLKGEKTKKNKKDKRENIDTKGGPN